MPKQEYWANVPLSGYLHYQVSTLGRVRKFCGNGTIKIIKPRIGKTGYCQVWLDKWLKGEFKKKSAFKVHRLVAKTFIPFKQIDYERIFVNHKNLNKLDNRATNLEWRSPSENTQHAWDNGAFKKRCSDG